jgi:hypothetical protein
MIHDHIFRDLHRHMLHDALAPPIPVAPASPPPPPLDSYVEQFSRTTSHNTTRSSHSCLMAMRQHT